MELQKSLIATEDIVEACEVCRRRRRGLWGCVGGAGKGFSDFDRVSSEALDT